MIVDPSNRLVRVLAIAGFICCGFWSLEHFFYGSGWMGVFWGVFAGINATTILRGKS